MKEGRVARADRLGERAGVSKMRVGDEHAVDYKICRTFIHDA